MNKATTKLNENVKHLTELEEAQRLAKGEIDVVQKNVKATVEEA